MGADTSALRNDLDDLDDDVRDIDRAFETHRADYDRFPSSDGLALRTRLETLMSNGSAQGGTTDAKVTALETAASGLALRVNTVETGHATLTSATTKLQSSLAMLQGQYGSTASGQCEVTFQCPLDTSYASSADLALLRTTVGAKATQSVVHALKKRVVSLESAPTQVVDMTAVESKAEQSELNALYERVGAAAGSAAATGLFARVGAKADQAEFTTLSAAVGQAAAGGVAATGLFARVEADQAEFTTLSTAVGQAAAGGVAATGLFERVEADQAEFTTLSAAVGQAAAGDVAATGLFERVEALEVAPAGESRPVDVTSIYSSAVGRATAMSACYPDVGGKLRDFIEKDCKSRGEGWSHGGSEMGAGLVQCFREKTTSSNGRYTTSSTTTFKQGTCHQNVG